jgi:probable phosphoglycerate mutase
MRERPELLLLRHGETEWNREGRFQGALDSSLTARGRAQAEALGALLEALGVGPATHDARTSPQGRAKETARIALSPLSLAVREDPRLVEIGMGGWTGLSRSEIAVRWPGPEAEGVLAFYARCPGGERLGEVAERAARLLGELRRPTVVVSHGITLRVLCALALGRPLTEAEAFVVPQGALGRIADGCLHVITPGPQGLPGQAQRGSPGSEGG